MIGLFELTQQLAALIYEKTQLFATGERLENAVYPCVSIDVCAKLTAPSSGGRQLERELELTLTCRGERSRPRQGGLRMADRLQEVLLPAFSLCGRSFRPQEMEVRMQQELPQVRFHLTFWDVPDAETEKPDAEAMGTLALNLTRS